MISKLKHDSKGQALVEFALVLVVLLSMIFTIVEAGRLFQGWVTVQNSTRAASRYAITGQFETDCLSEIPQCVDPRVNSIEAEARRTVSGLSVDPNALAGEPRSLVILVEGQDADGVWHTDYAGASGQNVVVRVDYYMPIVTPLLRPIAESVRLRGQVVAVTEHYDQFAAAEIYNEPPDAGSVGTGAILPEADVAITKTITTIDVIPGGPTSIYALGQVEFQIEVKNNGPNEARDVRVADVLPDNMIYTAYSATGGSICDDPASPAEVIDRIDCQLPNLGVDDVVFLTIQTNSPLSPTYQIMTNTVLIDIGPDRVDPVPGNNFEDAEFELVPHFDLNIEKSDSRDPTEVGVALTYVVTVTNNGPNVAKSVVLTDRLPNTFNYSGIITSTGTICSFSDPDITCNLGDLTSGQVVVAEVTGVPTADGTITNNAWLTIDNPIEEEDSSNNTTSEDTFVQTIADLWPQKTGPDVVLDGEIFTYNITVNNNGPSPVASVYVTDSLPIIPGAGVGVTVLSSSVPCTPQPLNSLRCDVGTVLPFVPKSFTIDVQAIEPGFAINNVEVDVNDIIDPDLTNNDNTAQTTIEHVSDLSAEKSSDPVATPGRDLEYTIEINNAGPSTALDTKITDTLDDHIIPDLDQFTISGCGSPSINRVDGDNVFTCLIGDIAEGSTATVNLTVPITTNVASNVTEIVNNVIVDTRSIDPNSGNDDDEARTPVVFPVDLDVTKKAPGSVEMGSSFIYEIVVTNAGPEDAENVVVTDILPSEVTFEQVSPDEDCSYSAATVTVTCTFAKIEDEGDSETIQITVTANAVGTDVLNGVAVVSNKPDGDSSNNTAETETDIIPIADLISDIHPASTVITAGLGMGNEFFLTYIITNIGPSPAEDIVFTLTTDIRADRFSIESANYTCVELGSGTAPATIECTIGTLAVGGPYNVTLELRGGQAGIFSHSGIVTSTTDDPDPINNGLGSGTFVFQ